VGWDFCRVGTAHHLIGGRCPPYNLCDFGAGRTIGMVRNIMRNTKSSVARQKFLTPSNSPGSGEDCNPSLPYKEMSNSSPLSS
jgi:hypothetical protein